MGDFGIKISDETKNVFTSTLADTSFDSRYSSLLLLSKQTLEFTAEAGQTSPTGTATYTHSLGYCPLVLGFVDYTTNSVTHSDNILPYAFYFELAGGSYLQSSILMDIDSTKIDVDWETIEFLPGEELELSYDVDYTVTLHIYGFELGQSTD